MGDLCYVHEKFSTTRWILATGDGDLATRFWDAWVSQLNRGYFDSPDEVPPELYERVSDLFRDLDAMTDAATPVRDEGTIAAAVREASPEALSDLVRRVVELAGELDAHHYSSPSYI